MASTSADVKFSNILDVKGRQVIDSRGNPTVEVDIVTQDGVFRSIVPSGASTGEYEAHELRDGGKAFNGKGVLKAVAFVNGEIKDLVMGMNVLEQRKLDEALCKLDGTPSKKRLGANSILGVSLSACKAAAKAKKVSLFDHLADLAGNPDRSTMPIPCFNVINGGQHAGNDLAFQEFFIIPTGAESFAEAVQIGCECFHSLKKVLKQKFGGEATLIGDEGGFAPPVDATEAIELITEAVKLAGYAEGKVSLGMDVASSEFFVRETGMYDLDFKRSGKDKDPKKMLTADQLSDYYCELIEKYPIVTIEDPFDQNDWKSWTNFNKRVKDKVQVVGDDLTVTNVDKIKEAIKLDSCNALLLKVNQIGSVTESLDAVKLAKENGWGVMTSHRSGEAEDTTIADIAVGWSTGQIKTGAPCRGERTAKYNQLLRIEQQLKEENRNPVFAGMEFRKTKWMGK